MTVALYCRVSTDEQAEHGYSIDNQKERLVAFCTSQGWDDYQLYVDDGFTGTNIDRPALQRLLHHIRTGMVHMVVVYKLDRLSRKQKDVLYLLEDQFERHNVAFKSSTEPFDTSTPLGKAMLGILAVFAQLERDTIVERLATGLRQRVRSGKWSGGRQPFGYTYNDSTGKLEAAEHQAALLREMYRMYLQGHSLSDLAEWMGNRTRERVFNHTTVREMLTRRLYIGESSFGTVHSNDIAEPIIDTEVFWMVQREIEKRKEGKAAVGEYLLTGLMRCSLCNGPIIHIIRRNTKGNRNVYHLYACKNQHYRPRNSTQQLCKVGYRRQDALEQWVIDHIRSVALDPQEINNQLEAIKQASHGNRAVLAEVKRKLKDVDTKLDKWYEAFEEGSFDPARVKYRTERLEEERRILTRQIMDLEEEQPDIDTTQVHDALQLISEAWDYMTFGEQRSVLRAAIDTIVITPKGQDPKIIWNI